MRGFAAGIDCTEDIREPLRTLTRVCSISQPVSLDAMFRRYFVGRRSLSLSDEVTARCDTGSLPNCFPFLALEAVYAVRFPAALLRRRRQLAQSLASPWREIWAQSKIRNPSIATLKPHSNGPSYSNTVIGTLAADGWAVTFGTARRGLGCGRSPPRSFLAVPNVIAHSSTASVPTSYYLMWHYNCL